MAHSLTANQRIARYRVIGHLADGGMGEVYLAQDDDLDRPVALKVLPQGLMHDVDRRRRFIAEAKTASSLNHPHIVTIYEIGEAAPEGADAPLHYMAMEFVDGRTLTELIVDDTVERDALLTAIAQAADGLAKAHEAGIVHRDLKPANIMVSRDGYAKVLDFGLAKLVERERPDEDATQVGGLTETGIVLGTAGYMSPEQVRAEELDARSDIFSLGCVLYEAVARVRPFRANTAVETLHQILHDEPAELESHGRELPVGSTTASGAMSEEESRGAHAIHARRVLGASRTHPAAGAPSAAPQSRASGRSHTRPARRGGGRASIHPLARRSA